MSSGDGDGEAVLASWLSSFRDSSTMSSDISHSLSNSSRWHARAKAGCGYKEMGGEKAMAMRSAEGKAFSR